MTSYERLRNADVLFLDAESDGNAMQIGLCMIFAQAPGPGSARCAPDPDRLLGFVESRLDCHPRYRQKLAKTPIDRWPVWISDLDFDLRRHVRYERFGPGSNEMSLRDRSAAFLAEPMDLDHPLWAILVLEGFAKDRFALVVKAHHCMADGIEGVELLHAMLDVEARSDFLRTPLRRLEESPSWGSLALSNGLERARAFMDLARGTLAAARRPAEVIDRFVGDSLGLLHFLELARKPKHPTALDAPAGPERGIEWMATDLSRIREIQEHRGGTVNDVVLATVSLALGRFLEAGGMTHEDQKSMALRVAIPVNRRGARDRAEGGNHISLMIAPLPIAERDPLVVLDKTRMVLAAAKASHMSDALAFIVDATEWMPRMVAHSLTRLALTRVHPASLVVTNVPGPVQPLYLLEASLESAYPIVPLMPGHALNVAVLSYAGRLFWTFHADAFAIGDLVGWSKEVQCAFEDIHAAATRV
jgi:WS/DGAT/MGAT family acyltransferase